MSQRRIRRRKAKARRAERKFEQQHPEVILYPDRMFRALQAGIMNHAKMTSIPMQGVR